MKIETRTDKDTNERVRIAYNAFLSGFSGFCPAPRWDEASPWVRDALKVAYLQGRLDGTSCVRDVVKVAYRQGKLDGSAASDDQPPSTARR